MAPPPQRHASARTASTPAPTSGRPAPDLKVARSPVAARRSLASIAITLALGLLVVYLTVAGLHPALVGKQASLDDLIEHNQQRYERINQLQAEIAYLDSPEGLAEQASVAGLVPAAELAVLTPVGPNLLRPPEADPFDLESSAPTALEPVESSGRKPTG